MVFIYMFFSYLCLLMKNKSLVYLLCGSNLGNRFEQLDIASALLSEKAGEVCASSSYYETAAWGIEDQPLFLNQAHGIHTDLSPIDLLVCLKGIEKEMGRIANGRWQERNIDIDIICYDRCIINSKELVIPHKMIAERRFTLEPLCEIAPKLIEPRSGKSIQELLKDCKDPLRVKILELS